MQSEQAILSRVVLNQLLWTAGYSLTTSGFLFYFASDLDAGSRMIALLHVIPEMVGVLGLSSRLWIRIIGNRKAIFLICSLAARLISLVIPLLAFATFRESILHPLWCFAAVVATLNIFQAIGYIAYLSWLSDLIERNHWGRFFAWRNIAKIIILLIVPVTAGFLRDWWKQHSTPDVSLWAYVAIYLMGTCLMVISLIPVLKLQNVNATFEHSSRVVSKYSSPFSRVNISLWFFYLHNWWLAFFNGLTQSVFFSLLFGPLKISLGWYYLLLSIMRLVKLPASYLSGRFCDQQYEKAVLIFSLLAASSGLLFWMKATPQEPFWIVGAYALWGLFAAANISGRNLLLKLAPSSNNSFELALFRQVSGLLAGLSGLLGGFWLQHMLDFPAQWKSFTFQFNEYQLIFLTSLAGRYLSLIWLLPVRIHSTDST